ncbi:hypothetical protein H5410_013524 [Solanum commersonii]|uniref:Uncharacterized protein n=1 Tax=Solanum commersonii TaxID=4109 RepID=A0A9J5ZNL8_SOLCO|nr:hypothetical protein H5410_013524 [Solanum commersonii]
METVGPHDLNGPFSMSNDPQSRIPPIFPKILHRRLLRNYPWSQLALTAKTTHFQGQMIPGTSIKTLPIKPVIPHGQNNPFSKSNDPRNKQTSHFTDFKLTYGASWPSWPKQSIFNAERSPERTLPMEPVGPHGQNDPFSRSKDPWSGPVKTLPMEPVGPLDQNGPYSKSNDPRSRPSRPKQIIFNVKRSPEQDSNLFDVLSSFTEMLKDFESWIGFDILVGRSRSRSWSSIEAGFSIFYLSRDNMKDLVGVIVLFNYSVNSTLVTLPLHPLRPYLWSQLSFTAKTAHFQGQRIPGADLTNEASWPTWLKQPIFKVKQFPEQTSVKKLAMEPVGPHGKNNPFSRSNDHPNLTYEENWPSWTKHPIFKVKRSPDWVNTLFCQFSCPIFHGFFGDPNFNIILAKILPRRALRPYLWRQLALLTKTDHFQCQTIPEAVHGIFGDLDFDLFFPKILHGRPLRNYTWSQLALTAKTAHFKDQMIPGADVHLDLTYGASWPYGQNNPFSKSNDPRSRETSHFAYFHNSELVFAKMLAGRSLRPYLGRQLALTTHFQCRTIPGTGKPPYFAYFCMLSSLEFLVIQNFNLIFAKILPVRPLKPYLWSQLALTAKMAHFQSQRIPGAGKPPILPIFNFDLIFAKILPVRPLRPYLWSQLALTAKMAHFQSQRIPGADLTYGASWPSRPKRPIFKVKRCSEQSNNFLVIRNFDLIFAKILPGRLVRPYLWSQLAITTKMAHFQGQTIPGAINAIFGDPEYQTHFCQNFTSTSVKTLIVDLVEPHCQNNPFQGQAITVAVKSFPMEPVGPHGQNGPFSRSNDHRSRRPLRPYLWIQLALPAKTAHFKVKRYPEQTLPMEPVGPHGQNYSFSRSNDIRSGPWNFWLSEISTSVFPKFYSDVCEDQLALTAKTTHFKGQTILEEGKPTILPIFNFNLIFAKILRGRPLRPYLWSQLALLTKMAHFQGQTIFEEGKPPILPIFTLPMERLALRLKRPIFKVKRSTGRTSVKTLTMDPVGPTAKTAHFQGHAIPEAVHGFFGYTKFRPQFWQNFTWTSVKTLTMETVSPHGQNDPFSRSNDPRSSWPSRPKRPIFKNSDLIFAKILPGHPLKPYICRMLALTAKTTQFQGQTILEIDLTYGASWPLHLKWPIFKVKRSPEQTLHMEASWPSRPKAHFQGQAIQGESMDFLVIQNSDLIFAKISPETSFKTLPMEPIGPHSQNDPFSGQTIPKADFTYGANWPSRPKRPIFKVKRSLEKSMEFLVIQNFDLIFAKILPGRLLGPLLWSQLALTAKTTHFHGQTIPGADLTYGAKCSSRPKWPIIKVKGSPEHTSVKTLPMDPVGPHGQNGPFSRSNDPEFWKNFTWTSVKTLTMETVGPHRQNGPFSRLNNPRSRIPTYFLQKFYMDLTYEASWPSRPKQPIFKSNDPRIGIDLFFAKILHGRPLRNYPWSQLALTAKMAHFQGQMIPEKASWPSWPKQPFFKVKRSPERSMDFLVIQNFDLIFAKILPRHLLKPYLWRQLALMTKTDHFKNSDLFFAKILHRRPLRNYPWSQLALTTKTAHFQGQMIPEVVRGFLMIQNFDLIFAKILPRRPLRPYLRSQLALTAKTTHFQSQMIPVADLTYGASWPSWPKWPIFNVERSLELASIKTLPMERFALADKAAHFQGQAIHGKTSVKTLPTEPVGPHDQKQPIFKVKRSPKWSMKFLMIQIFDLIIAKILPGHPLRPYLWSGWPSRPKRPFSRSKRSRSSKPPFVDFHIIVHGFLVIEFQPHFAKIFTGRPLRPLWSRWPQCKATHFKCQAIRGRDLRPYLWSELASSHNGPFQGQRSPGRSMDFGDPNFDLILSKFYTGVVKTLPMEQVGPHGQNGHFGSSDRSGRPLRPYLWSGWPSRPKRPISRSNIPEAGKPHFANFDLTWNGWPSWPKGHFQGQSDPRAELTYGVSWPQAKWPIFQGQTIPEATLLMEPVDYYGQNGPFSRSNDPENRNYDLILPNFTSASVKTLPMEQLNLTAKMAHFQGQTIPDESFPMEKLALRPKRPIFKNFNLIFTKILLRRPLRPYLYRSIGPTQLSIPFSSQSDPEATLPIEQLALAKATHFQVKAIPRRRLYLWSQLALTAKMTHFKGQTIPKADLTYGANWPSRPKRPILKGKRSSEKPKRSIFMVKRSPEQSMDFLVIQNFDLIFQNFTWTSVKTLPMEPVGLHGQRPFSRSRIRPKRPIFKVKGSPEKINTQFCQFLYAVICGFFDLTYGAVGLRPKAAIFKTSVKTLPMESVGPHSQNDPFSRSNDPRRRPYFWSKLDLTAKKAHFQGQTILGADLTYGASWPSRPKRPIFKVKRSAEKFTIFIDDSKFPPHFCQNLPGRLLRPYLRSQLALTTKMTHFQGQMISGADLTYGASWSSRSKHPIFKVKRSPEAGKPPILPIFIPYLWSQLALALKRPIFRSKDPGSNLTYGSSWPSRQKGPILKVKRSSEQINPLSCRFSCAIVHGFLMIQNFDLIFAKILPAHPLRPYLWSQLGSRPKQPIFKVKRSPERSMEFLVIQNFDLIFAKILHGRPLRPYLWSQLALTAKTAHFKGQMIFGVVHGFLMIQNFDLIFAKILPRRPLRPYLWSQLALTAKADHFQDMIKPVCPFSVEPHGQNNPFQGQTITGVVHEFFGDPEFHPHFYQNVTWTSVKSFSMEPVGPHGQNGLFSRSNDHRSRQTPNFANFYLTYGASWPSRPKWPIFKVIRNFDLIFPKILPGHPLRPYLWSQLALTAKTSHFQLKSPEQTSFLPNFTWTTVKTLPREPIDPHGQNAPFSRSNDLRSKPYLWSQLALWPATHSRSNDPQKFTIFLVIEFQPHFAKFYKSVKTLPMERLALRPKAAHFQCQAITAGKPLFTDFHMLYSPFLVIQNFDLIFQNFTDIDLTYGAIGPHYPKRPISRSSDPRAIHENFWLIRNTKLIFSKILPGHPLRPYLWSQLALMAKTANFQGQTIPEKSMDFLVIHNSNLIFAKILPGRPLPYLWSKLALTSMDFLVIGIFDLIFTKNLPGCPLRPYMEPFGPHGQNGLFSRLNKPRAELTYRSNWPSRPKRLISKVKRAPKQVIRNSELIFAKNFTWTSFKTLPMEPVGPEMIRASKPLTPECAIVHSGFLTLPVELVGPHQNRPFSRSNNPQSRKTPVLPIFIPYLLSQLALTSKTVHFQGQTCFTVDKPPLLPIFMCYCSPYFLVIRNFDIISAKILPERPLRPYLCRQFTHGQNGPFSRIPTSFEPKFYMEVVKTYPMDSVVPHGENDQFSMSNDPQSSWPSRPKRPIFKVKRSRSWTSVKTLPMELVGPLSQNAPFSRPYHMEPIGPHGQNDPFSRSDDPRIRHPLRPYLWIQLSLTAKMANFQRQTIPGEGKLPILPIFEYYSPWIFGDLEFQPHFC